MDGLAFAVVLSYLFAFVAGHEVSVYGVLERSSVLVFEWWSAVALAWLGSGLSGGHRLDLMMYMMVIGDRMIIRMAMISNGVILLRVSQKVSLAVVGGYRSELIDKPHTGDNQGNYSQSNEYRKPYRRNHLRSDGPKQN